MTEPSQADRSTGSLFRQSIPCDLKAVREAVVGGSRFLTGQGVTEDEAIACELALAEACNNAIDYAGSGPRLPIGIDVTCSRDLIELQVTDHTEGFQWPREFVLPETEAEHGRGLYIIHQLMDQVFYLRGDQENRLVMRKRRTTPAGPNDHFLELDGFMPRLAVPAEIQVAPISPSTAEPLASARIMEPGSRDLLAAQELQIARNIQQSLLPRVLPKMPGYSVAGFCLSAREVGGDFYDLQALPDGSVLLVVADVMGKGVPAALFAATFRTLVRTMAGLAQSPSELLTRINRLMFDELSGVDMFITAQLGLIQFRQRQLVVASAGHCPVLYSTTGGETRSISPEGMPLGILRDAPFAEESISLEPMCSVLFYTDGVTEARNSSGDFLGQSRLLEWLRSGVGQRLGAPELKRLLLGELEKFQSRLMPTDDQTFLILSHELPEPAITLAPGSTASPGLA